MTIVATIGMAACTEAPRSQHTVDYYRAHVEARRDRLKECSNDPGALAATPDCGNALEADRLEGIGSFQKLPPMEMPPVPATRKPPK